MTTVSSPPFDAYLPIADYAVIGNQYTTAVVSRDGAVVWCCFPELRDGSVFASLLDHRKGGLFRIHPLERATVTREYVDRTAVLLTRFVTPTGVLSTTDFMPIRGSIVGCAGADAPPEMHRVLQCERGEVQVQVEWSPRFDYARARTAIDRTRNGFVARGAAGVLALSGLPHGTIGQDAAGPSVHGRLTLRAGEALALVTRHGVVDATASLDDSRRARDETIAAWHGWAEAGGLDSDYAWAGAYRPYVERAAIVLKMLTHPRTGGIAAAPTTSLPEWIGGVRNWDYRYAWIRDASFTVQALLAVGHSQEAKDFVEFAERAAMDQEKGHHDIKLMYDLHGGITPAEEELDHLEGYRQSQPVRIGNGARFQVQHDVYGELIDSAYELLRRGGRLDPEVFAFLARLADQACEVWREPDDGIWEFRAEPKHYTYSKVMIWVALDRAVRLAEQHGMQGDVDRWRHTRALVREDVLANGYDREVGAFVIAYDSKELDAANLRIPLLEFLPCADDRVQNTIDRTLEQLTKNGLVYRYLLDDGLPGHEGAFGLCTFWMSEALALSGRLEEAREILDGMVRRANDVGLYSEEIDPATGAFLGNFPQAFTHIGLINSVLYLAAAEGRRNQHVPELEGLPSMCAPGELRRG